MSSTVVTRFAPSPTGFLHIGGGRTALFNWLFARQHGGRMLLRIEDTDRERSTEPAIAAILDGIKWLGLEWDGEIVHQFARAARHAEVARDLLARGHAYHCYASAQDLDDMREKARAEGRPPRYDGRWRDRDQASAPAGVKPVVRFRAPQHGETTIRDQVQGDVTIPNKDLDDLILLRSDGTPTYMLAVVVDDHDMGITHIIRGDDHLTNAARQMQIYEACGWPVPSMSHIPLIHGADGAKLSKRHGALAVDAYRAMGFLPAAMRNYLLRLGWSNGNNDDLSTQEMIAAFRLDQVGRSPSRFDFAKLANINGHFMRTTPDAEIYAAVETVLECPASATPQSADSKAPPTIETLFPSAAERAAVLARWRGDLRDKAMAALPGLKERAKTVVEMIGNANYLFASRPLAVDAKAREALDAPGIRGHLAELRKGLQSLETWDAASAEAVVRDYAAAQGLKLGQAAQPLRMALTGQTTSPGIFDVLAVLGKDESLARIGDQVAC